MPEQDKMLANGKGRFLDIGLSAVGASMGIARALFGGHIGGALIGIVCIRMFGDALRVSVLGVVLTMVFMVATRTVHPPAGSGVLALFLVALVWSRVRPGREYPVRWW